MAVSPDPPHRIGGLAIKLVEARPGQLASPCQHAAVSAMMWAQVALSALLAISLYRHTAALALCAVAYACAYHAWYRRLAGPIADTSIPA